MIILSADMRSKYARKYVRRRSASISSICITGCELNLVVMSLPRSLDTQELKFTLLFFFLTILYGPIVARFVERRVSVLKSIQTFSFRAP